MQPAVINEMKSRIEIIKQDHYNPVHMYLSNLLISLDHEAEDLLERRNFDHLVQKKIIFGNTYSSKSTSTYRSIYYFLEYTFFEDVEDEHGYRENDVTIGFSVSYFVNDEFRITRDISSDFEDIGYSKIERCTSISQDSFDEIDKMKPDFLKVLNRFIENRK